MSVTEMRAPTDLGASTPQGSPTPSSGGRKRRSARGGWRSSGVMLLVMGFLILVPAGFVLLAAFSETVPRPGSITLDLTLGNFAVLGEPGVVKATVNSLVIATLSTVLALAIGGFLAFTTARTNIPFKGLVYLFGLMPLFLPSYVGALAWSILGSPAAGLLNIGLRDLGLTGFVNVYSIPGVVMVMAVFYAPYAFLLIHSSMSLMNPDLEDASAVHGGSQWRTLRTVTFPLAMPAIVGSALLIFTHVLENFPVSQVLASPGQIDTLPTFIYRLMNASPSRGNEASSVAILLVVFILVITWTQRVLLSRRAYTTVSGKGVKARKVDLGHLRWPLFVVATGYFLIAIALPILALLLTAMRTSPYMSSFRDLTAPGALDASSFGTVARSDVFLTAAGNSVVVALLSAAGGTVLAFLVAYVVYRTRARARGLLEGVSMVPLAIPAIVLGIGLLWTWLVMPIPLYGTLWVMVIAFLAVQMPQGLRGIAASIQSTDKDLEDSAVLHGAHRARAITAITVPLMKVGLTSTFLILLMLSMRELTVPLFLYTNDTRILSIAIFDQFENGGALQQAAAMSLIYCLIMFVLSCLPRLLGSRGGLNNH